MRKMYISLFLLLGAIGLRADDLTALVTNATGGLPNGGIILTVSGGAEPFSFSWSGPGGFSSSEKDISALSAGEYCVTVTDTYCGTAQLCITVEEEPLSAPDMMAEVLTVSPNPFYGELNISVNISAPAQYTIVLADESGKEIFALQKYFSSGDHTIPLPVAADLPAGNYIFSLIQEEHILTKKLVHIN